MLKRSLVYGLLLFFVTGGVYAQKYSKGHPGYKKQQRKKRKRFARQTKKAVKKVQKQHAGTFPLVYRKVFFFKKKQLQLTLTKVHRKKFFKMNDSVTFICANFRGRDSVLYDIDIFMKKPKGAKKYTTITNRMVHKVNHYPLFTWYQDTGRWHRCQVRKPKFIDRAKREKVAPPGNNKENSSQKDVKSKQLAKKVRKMIIKQQQKQGGYPVNIPGQKTPITLQLKKVHKNDHFTVDDSTAAICVDFVGGDGLSYDADIWVTRQGGKYNKITQAAIHKVEGRPLYAWYNDRGTWRKCPVRSVEEVKAALQQSNQ